MAQAIDFPDMKSIESSITMLCSAIEKKPDSAGSLIDKIHNSMTEHQQYIQQRFPNIYAYITNQDNKSKLKAGGEKCKMFFNGLKVPLSMDYENNKEAFQHLQQFMSQHIQDFIARIQ